MEENMFTTMFEGIGVVPEPKKKKFDFGESMGGDEDTDKTAAKLRVVPSARDAGKGAAEQPTTHPSTQPDTRTVTHTDSQTLDHTDSQTPAQTPNQTHAQPGSQPHNQPVTRDVALKLHDDLTDNQVRTLSFLISNADGNGEGITNRKIISIQAHVALGTVRDNVPVLIESGYITRKEPYSSHSFRGFKYALNMVKCSRFGQPLIQPHAPPHSQPLTQTDRQTDTPFSSKVLSLSKNLTTETVSPGILDDPELLWWKGREPGEGGITDQKVEGWMAKFRINRDEMILSLRHGKFDILRLGNVRVPADWFHSRLVSDNAYYCPDYKSPTERRAEALQAQVARDKKAREDGQTAELELRFMGLMLDKESPEYQALYNALDPSTTSGPFACPPAAIEAAMRELFFAKNGIKTQNKELL